MRSYNMELCGSNGTEHERWKTIHPLPCSNIRKFDGIHGMSLLRREACWIRDETHRIQTAELVSSA